jgi:16S rRNA (guanine966-N2)-methyltransferase
MKITSGEFAGIPLFTPKNYDVRPTLAKTRQAVFNMLRGSFEGTVCADVFCGTGAYGFEALSNGAVKVYFIDKANRELLVRNAAKLKVSPGRYEIINADYQKGLGLMEKKGIKADVVFCDPPYNMGYITNLLKNGLISDILNKGAMIVLEVHRKERDEIDVLLDDWAVFKEKQYGDACILCLKEPEND